MIKKIALYTIAVILLNHPICYGSEKLYDLFGGFIPYGTPAIDGRISPGEWDESGNRTLYKFFGEDSKIEIYLMWDDEHLYVGAHIEDFELWVDNVDPSNPQASTWHDDAFKFEIDPDRSRDEQMQWDDRVFAVNADGSAARFERGNGHGETIPARLIDPLKMSVRYEGTLNDFTFEKISREEQKDKGFTVEAALSWRNIFGTYSPPTLADGRLLGIHFTHIEDDTGGPLNAGYHKEWKRVPDEITRFMGEEGRPRNWAEWSLSSRSDRIPPDPVSNLHIDRIQSHCLTVSFTAPGDNGSSGYAAAYDIRYSSTPITGESDWLRATVYHNSFQPQKAGKKESFKVVGLTPSTTFHIGIKAADEEGNFSSIASIQAKTKSLAYSEDKGFLTVDPGQRYFCWENGEPFFVIGDNQGLSWPYIRSFYNHPMYNRASQNWSNFHEMDTPESGREYLEYLSRHGVNTIRIMAEDMDSDYPTYLYKDLSKGPQAIVFEQATLDFLETLLDNCALYGINVIIVPFDTFFYRKNWDTNPFNKSNGGPLDDPSELYEPVALEYIKAILKKLVDTIGNRRNLMAWDIINEFDSDEPGIGWTRASFAQKEEAVNQLAAFLKSIDPDHMIYLSSVRWDPKFTSHLPTTPMSGIMGADPMLVLNNSLCDFNSTHTYYHDLRDPNFNHPDNRTPKDGKFSYRPEVTDIDNTIAPAVRIKQGLQFYHANTLTPKPYLNTEYGPISLYVRRYDDFFTAENDNQYFHNSMWSFLASGDAGTGLRWPGIMLPKHALSDTMRKYQLALKNFLSSNLIFFGYNPSPIGQYIEVAGTKVPVIKLGISDKMQGILFLVKDTRKFLYDTVDGARISVPRLLPHGRYTFEFWDSYDHKRKGPFSSVSVLAGSSGKVWVSLPPFEKTLAIKFYWTGIEPPEADVQTSD